MHSRRRLQNNEPAVLPKMFIERDSLGDFQTFHYREADGIAVAKVLVLVLFNDTPRSPLVLLFYADNIGAASVEGLKKLPGAAPSSTHLVSTNIDLIDCKR
jgi:hypothetical protein